MKNYLALIIAFMIACNEPSTSESDSLDSMPVIKPSITDTSGVITPPPTGDSMAVHPDSSLESR